MGSEPDDDWLMDLVRHPTWQHVAIVVVLVGLVVASFFAPDAGCSVRISDTPTTTTSPS